jgi:hypothetical protein
MHEDPQRPPDVVSGERRARRRAEALRREQMAARERRMLAAVGLPILALLLLIGVPIYLMSDVATADQAFPALPRVDALALVRELGGHYSQAGDIRSTALPTATPLSRDYRSATSGGTAPELWRAAPEPEGQAPSMGARKLPATGGSGAAAAPATAGGSPTPQLWATRGPTVSGTPAASASPISLAMAPAFGSQAVIPSRTPVPPTPVPPTPVPPTAVPTSTLVPATAVPTTPPSTPSPTPPRTPTTDPTSAAVVALARRQDSGGVGAAPAAPAAVVAATPIPVSLTGYKLGDVVQITTILKGFASTSHWVGSPEGIYATDWYPRSATERCADSHRMPLAMPVAGKWRFISAPGPMGPMYSLIGELDDGNTVGFTHVDSDVLTGWAAANTVVGFVGISGLEQLDAIGMHPSHAHTAWNIGVVPGWDGDRGNQPAKDFFAKYGFQVELRDPSRAVSPMMYMSHQSCGGSQ